MRLPPFLVSVFGVAGCGFGAPAGEVAGARVCEVGAAAGPPAALLEVGVADAVRGGAGDLGPGRFLVGVGLPVSGVEAGSLPGLVHLAGQLRR